MILYNSIVEQIHRDDNYIRTRIKTLENWATGALSRGAVVCMKTPSSSPPRQSLYNKKTRKRYVRTAHNNSAPRPDQNRQSTWCGERKPYHRTISPGRNSTIIAQWPSSAADLKTFDNPRTHYYHIGTTRTKLPDCRTHIITCYRAKLA